MALSALELGSSTVLSQGRWSVCADEFDSPIDLKKGKAGWDRPVLFKWTLTTT